MKRILSGLVALCLLCGTALADSGERPSLSCRRQGEDIRLALENLEDQVYALQLTLALEGDCPDARFAPEAADAYGPDCHVETERGGTQVTIYLVAEGAAFRRGRLPLGILTPEGDCRLPARAELLLLNKEGRSVFEGRVPLTEEDAAAGDLGRVHIARMDHGTVTVRPAGAEEGETVLLNVSPDAGYVLESIAARDSRGGEVPLTRDGLDRYTFRMPALDVEVAADFSAGGELGFRDVLPGDWCYDAVRYVFQAGLMNGTSADAFTPDTPTTRGQIVAILYRLEGSPSVGAARFSDVVPGAYYTAAVAWATANGIVNGYGDGTFRPNELITREQLAAFLYRYAVQKGRDVSDRAELSVFTDAGQTAAYAVEPLGWATAAGLINGVSADTLAPRGTASRAQVAVTLSRFVKNVF